MYFYLGCCFASFCNVVIARTKKEESFIIGRSYCDKCHHILSYKELFPIISYLLYGGKCRHCHHKISLLYPITECIFGLIFVFLTKQFGHVLGLLLSFYFCHLYVISMLDIQTMYIYDWTLVSLGMNSLMLLPYVDINLKNYVLLLIVIFVFYLLFKNSIGFGDIELIVILGMLHTLQRYINALYLSCLLGSVTSCLLILLKQKTRKDYIPFAPFLCIGYFLSLLVALTVVK